jgi:hypothetical protein
MVMTLIPIGSFAFASDADDDLLPTDETPALDTGLDVLDTDDAADFIDLKSLSEKIGLFTLGEIETLAVGDKKANWVQVASPNSGAPNEWVYTGDTGGTSATPAPVNTWTNLQTALNAVGTYTPSASNGNELPHVIYVSGDITMGALYTISSKNIILRKWDSSATGNEPKPWNYANPWINTDAATPDLYDGIADYKISQNGTGRHFDVDGTSKLVLENVSLDGGNTTWSPSHDAPDGHSGGGLNLSAVNTNLTFAGNIVNCYSTGQGGAVAIPVAGAAAFDMFGGAISHCRAMTGGCISYASNPATGYVLTLRGNSILEGGFTTNEGGAVFFRNGIIDIGGNTIIRNNKASNGGAAVFTHSELGGTTFTLHGNVLITGNEALAGNTKPWNSPFYPGNGGGIYMGAYNFDDTLTISDNVQIVGNIAARGGGGLALGSRTSHSVTVTLNGGTIANNTSTGRNRDLPAGASDEDRYSIGGGGGIFSYDVSKIFIPSNSSIEFSGNSAAYIGLVDVSNPPTTYTPWVSGEKYYNHINPAYDDSDNSAGFPAPYDNLYTNYDIGIPNTLASDFGKLKIQTKVGTTYGIGGAVVRTTGTYMDVFPAHDWLGLDVGTGGTFTAVPDLGYRFTGWTRSSSVYLLATEWTTAMVAGAWNLSTNDANRNGATSTVNPAVISAMPAADITLTANFEKIPTAELTGFTALNWQATLTGGVYTQPSQENVTLTNSVSGTTATSVSVALSDIRKNGEVWSSPTPFILTPGNSSIVGGAGPNISWKVRPAANLTEPGNYTATLTLSYQNGVDAAPITQSVQISFALIDPNTPLFVLNNIDFGSVVGSSYTVQAGDVSAGEDVARERIVIQNLSASANLLAISLAGADAEDFTIISGNSSVPQWGSDDSWQVVPRAGLVPGTYDATIRVGYVAADGGVSISSVAPVTFTVLRPAALSANPSVYSFDTVSAGYIPSLKDIVLTNNGETSGYITSITHKSGDSAFNTINTTGSGSVEVNAGNTNRSFQISPKPGLANGFYSEVLTITYEYTVSGVVGPVTSTIDITATLPVGVAGFIVTVNYLDIDGNGALRTSVPVFVESGGTYTSPEAYKNTFISGGKNYGYYGYQIDTGGIVSSANLPGPLTITGTHTVNYYYGTQDVTVDAGIGGQTPSGSGNYAYGSTVEISARSQTGYSFSSFTQAPAGSVTISAPSTAGRRTTASFTAGHGALVVTPTFAPKTYTININSKGGSHIDSAVDQTTGSVISFDSPTREADYVFLGYSKTDGGPAINTYQSFTLDASMISDLFANDTTNETTLYAVWAHANTMKITSISPTSGVAAGGTAVTITGFAFKPLDNSASVTISFGGTAVDAADVVSVSNTAIVVKTPAHSPGIVSVVVDNGDETAGYGPVADKPGGFSGIWTEAAGGYEYTALISTSLNYVTESIDKLNTTNNPSAQEWFYSTVSSSGPWTSFVPDGSGSATLVSLGSEPNDYGGANKLLHIAYATTAGANVPDSNVSVITIKPRPATPTGLTGGNNLIVGGVTTQEFKLTGAGSWTDITSASQSTGSSYGDYQVRVKAVNDNPDASPSPIVGNFRSLIADVKVYRAGSISINGDADVPAFTYPETFDSKVAVSTVTVTTNESTPQFYYMDGGTSPKPTPATGGWTTGKPVIPGEYWVYATVAADTDTAKYYNAATSAVVKVIWNKKQLVVSSSTTFTKPYDGDTSVTLPASDFPALTTATNSTDVSGQVVFGDTVAVTGPTSIAYTYNSKDVATANKVTSAASGFSISGTIAGGGDAADFYTLGSSDLEWTASITRATVTVDFTGLTFEKTYNKSSTATPSGTLALAGVVGTEAVSVTASGVTYFYGTTSSAATDQASGTANQSVYITSGDQSKFALDGADKDNYQLTSPSQGTAVTTTGWIKRIAIAPADLIWTIDNANPAPDPLSVAFNESAHTISATVDASKLISGDVVIVPLTGNVTETAVSSTYSANADNNGSGALNGANGANYTLSADADQAWAISSALPGAPGVPTGSGSTVTGGTISWLHPTFTGGVALTTYELQVVAYGNKGDTLPPDFNWQTDGIGPTMTDNGITTIAGGVSQSYSVPSTIVTGLDADLAYAVRVRASNDGGLSYGPWSQDGQLNIDRETPILTADPFVITYGTSLGVIADNDFAGYLADLTATYPSGGSAVAGTWSWSYADDSAKWSTSINADTIPTVQSPALSFTLLFTPTNVALYNSQTIEVEVQVSPKPINLDTSALAFEKVYDGTVQANSGRTGAVTIASGQIVSRGGTPDAVTVTDSGVNYVYDTANIGTTHTVSVATDGSSANLIFQGADATNYSINNVSAGTTVSTTGVITAYPLVFSWTLDGTITAEPYQATYDASTHTMVATASGVSGETVTVATYASSGTTLASAINADDYTAEVSTILVTGGQASTDNYSFSTLEAASHAVQNWQILKAQVPVSWTTGSFIYNKSAQAPTATYAPSGGGTITFDTLITAQSGSSTTAGSAINAGSYTATAQETGNYIPIVVGEQAITQDFSISPKPLNVDISSVDNKSFIYNGQNFFAFTDSAQPVIDSSGIEAGDLVGINLGSARWHLSGNTVGTGYTVTIDGTIELSGASASNYSILVIGTPKANIVPCDKTALIKLYDSIIAIDLHQENYTQAALDELFAKLDAANEIIEDDNVLQSQVDDALSDLQTAFDNMYHDHPVIKAAHEVDGDKNDHLTAFGLESVIEIKGDIRDVSQLTINASDYPLVKTGPETYNIIEGGETIGTITEGSAVLTLSTTFADRLANGTHTVQLFFTDQIGTGSGTAKIVVERAGQPKTPTIPGKLPSTGDKVNALIVFGLFVFNGLLALFLSEALGHKRRRWIPRRASE